MRRREFITLLGGAAAAWPLAARAQQPAMPVIGFLERRLRRPADRAVRRISQRPERGRLCRRPERRDRISAGRRASTSALPELAADLVAPQVTVIVTPAGATAALAAKAATTTIPIVFGSGGDPVKGAWSPASARPGGNLTGVNFFTVELVAKRMRVTARAGACSETRRRAGRPGRPGRLSSRARHRGSRRRTTNSRSWCLHRSRIDAAFARHGARRSLMLCWSVRARSSTPGVSNSRHWRRVTRLPAIYPVRAYPEAGGLMSYGSDIFDAYRQVGVYAGAYPQGREAGRPAGRCSRPSSSW